MSDGKIIPAGPQPDPTVGRWRLLARNPTTGDLEWEVVTDIRKAQAYADGRVDWRTAGGSEQPGGLFERSWKRLYGFFG